MTTVREFAQMLAALPEDQQDLPFLTCLGHSPECYFETPAGLYAQPETKTTRDALGNYHRTIGPLEHIRPTGD